MPLSGRDATRFEGAERAWQQALGQAGVGIWDLDGVELHDCFTMSELIQYESMGITEAGHGATAIHEGWTTREGRLPVNVSGGLKAKGHPVGATGVSMHVHAAMQLAGTAGAIQLDDVELFGVFNMGGASVANYATVLEAVR